MSKFKIGDKVIVNGNVDDSTKTFGIIKGREVIEQPNGKVRIEYVVKTGEGFDKWGVYSKKELTKVVKEEKKKSNPTLVIDAANGYKVTLVALSEKFVGLFGTWVKCLSIGYSIYNPNDEYDPEVGRRIALHRAKTKPFCCVASGFTGEFNNETVEALLKVKGEYIAKNISKFVNEQK